MTWWLLIGAALVSMTAQDTLQSVSTSFLIDNRAFLAGLPDWWADVLFLAWAGSGAFVLLKGPFWAKVCVVLALGAGSLAGAWLGIVASSWTERAFHIKTGV